MLRSSDGDIKDSILNPSSNSAREAILSPGYKLGPEIQAKNYLTKGTAQVASGGWICTRSSVIPATVRPPSWGSVGPTSSGEPPSTPPSTHRWRGAGGPGLLAGPTPLLTFRAGCGALASVFLHGIGFGAPSSPLGEGGGWEGRDGSLTRTVFPKCRRNPLMGRKIYFVGGDQHLKTIRDSLAQASVDLV